MPKLRRLVVENLERRDLLSVTLPFQYRYAPHGNVVCRRGYVDRDR